MDHKSGKYLEDLVAWIQQSVHEKALVIPNEKVLDIQTKKKRQIDISIRLSDGPTHLFVMVEVRDRTKPIDVRYIEEVHSKKQSVNANAASIVSRSGFTKTALEKAKHLGIQTLTYEDAIKSDWSGWIRCNSLRVYEKRSEAVLIDLGLDDSNPTLKLAPEVLSQVKGSIESKVLLSDEGKPLASFSDLANHIINSFGEKLYEGLEVNGEKVRRSLLFEGILQPQLFVLGDDGLKHKIVKVSVVADFYIKESKYPIHVSRYRNTGSKESIAEVATADIEVEGKKIRVDILAPYAGDSIPAGSRVQLRTTPLNNEPEESHQ